MIPKTQFTLRLNVMAHAKLKKMAEEQSRSLNNMIEHLIKQGIASYEQKQGEITITEEDLYIE